MHPYSSSNDYRFRPDCDAHRLTNIPVEQRDMGDWKGYEVAYLPTPDIPKDSLILDVGGEEGDTAVFFFEHGYTNLRIVEAYPPYYDNLSHNMEILRSLGCNVELVYGTFDPTAKLGDTGRNILDGVAFIKIDCEGCEWHPLFNLVNCGIPWGGELHMKGAPIRAGSEANDYYCSIGLFRGDGKSHFRQLEAHNMRRHNWSFYEEAGWPELEDKT